MIREGQVVLFSFSQTDQTRGTLRPALVLRQLPGPHGDWLICMISAQIRHEVPSFDEVIDDGDPDFVQTGLKYKSLVRISRVAVVSADLLHGAIGQLGEERMTRIRKRLAAWITGSMAPPGEQHAGPYPSRG